ncbi:MAG: hypothetical protein ACWA44_02525 [Thiotrichales bacterium]
MSDLARQRNRKELPKWFDNDDAQFFRDHISEKVWGDILSTYNHQALREECEANGIPINSVKFYWHKSRRISLFAKSENEGLPVEAIFDRLCQRAEGFAPPIFSFPTPLSSDFCAVINLYDAHLDKIALKSETREKITIKDNVARYTESFDRLLAGILSHNPEEIIFPVGNDFFHANDFTGKTKKGTAIQYLAAPEEVYPVICDVVVECIHKLAQTGAKVIIPFVKGNHDEDNITILGYWIKKLFADSPNVEFLPGRLQRNYHQFGSNLFGFAHGDKEKSKINELPLLMAEEASKEWAATKYRKFFCGDLHHEFEYKFLRVKDKPGVQISFLRSIGGSDKYHVDHGWIGIPKTAYAELWHRQEGKAAAYEVNF